MKRPLVDEVDQSDEPASKSRDVQRKYLESGSNSVSRSESKQDSEMITRVDDLLISAESAVFSTPKSSCINQLPEAALLKIFSLCRVETVLRSTRLVCRKWFNLCRDRTVWQEQDVYGTIEMTDTILHELLRYAPCRSLDLTNTPLVTEWGLRTALVHGRNLKTLSLTEGYIEINDEVLKAVVEHCPDFEDFRRNYINGSDQDSGSWEYSFLALLSKLTKLTRLDFRDCYCYFFDKQFVPFLQNFPHIRKLGLDMHSTYVGDRTLLSLPYQLTHLMLVGSSLHFPKHSTSISPDGIAAIAKLPNLQVLKIYHFHYMRAVTAKNLSQILENCRHIQTLHLCNVAFSDKMALCIARHGKSLKHLAFNGYRTLTDLGLIFIIQHCLKLVSLKLQEPRLTPAMFLYLIGWQLRKGCLKSLKVYYAELISLQCVGLVKSKCPSLRLKVHERLFVTHN